MACGGILRGWARSVSGNTAECILWIEDGIRDNREAGARIGLPLFLAMKAEALSEVDRISEALGAINEAEKLVERSEERCWRAELHRLRGVFLAAMGAGEAKVEASFCAAICTAKQQKSTSLAKTRRSDLRRVSQGKSERVGRTWSPTTSLVTDCSARTSARVAAQLAR